jgi:hypothetical protein
MGKNGRGCYQVCYQIPRMKVQFTLAPPQHRLYFLPEPQGQIRPESPCVSDPAISQCASDATPPVLAAGRQAETNKTEA